MNPAIISLAQEVAELCRRIDDVDYSRAAHPSYPQDRARLREIGKQAHAAGGIEAMRTLAEAASESYPNADSTLGARWSGIGDW